MQTLLPLGLLLCCLAHAAADILAPSVPQDGCCPNHNRTYIPRHRVTHVGMTPGGCRPKAMIITTVCKKLCIDPDWKWAKKLFAEFKKKTF